MTGSWGRILGAARDEEIRFVAASRNPRAAQLNLLRSILDRNCHTDFGRSHGFSTINDLAAYRNRVPMTGYDGFRSDIARIARGDQAVLTSEPVVAFEETGGSDAGTKLIPYTAASLDGFRRAVLPWLAGVVRRWPAVMAGRAYVTISPATRAPRQTAGGMAIGLPSDAAYLGEALAPSFAALLAVPPEVGAITDVAKWQVATLQALIAANDLAFISLWSPTFLTAMLASLPGHADAVLAGLPPPLRRRLDRGMAKTVLDTQALWPDLACISCWTDGPSAGFAGQLAHLFPHVAIDAKGLLATEAAISVTNVFEGFAVPALTSCVIEFVDDAGTVGLCDELVVGQDYRLIITTEGGLYRYAIGDVVRCMGHDRDNRLPQLRFLGRDGRVSDMVGEKLTETFVAEAFAGLGVAGHLVASDAPIGYELRLDGGHVGDPAALCARVEQCLCRNPQYAYARQIGQLAPLRVISERDIGGGAIRKGIASGRRMGDVKPLALIPLAGRESRP